MPVVNTTLKTRYVARYLAFNAHFVNAEGEHMTNSLPFQCFQERGVVTSSYARVRHLWIVITLGVYISSAHA